jgi:hypothetical protein
MCDMTTRNLTPPAAFQLTLPVSHLKDPDMQAAPKALMRAAENARKLAEQTGTPFVVRESSLTHEDTAEVAGKPNKDNKAA